MQLLQMLQDFGDEFIKVDTILIVIRMLTKHTVENAVIFATGDAYQFGAVEFETSDEARRFLGQLSADVAYAAMIDGEFTAYKHPYRSQVMNEWLFLGQEDIQAS
jgi:hypothetical protein